MKKTACMVMVCLGVAANTFGNLITFDLFGDPAIYSLLDDQVSGSITNGGLVAMFSTADGEMNRTGSGFGINAFASGDDTDGLNTGEFIDIVFDQAVVFGNLNVSSWGTSDAGEVQLRTTTGVLASKSIEGTGDKNTAFNFVVEDGRFIRILATADSGAANGFSIDSFTVAIPEPAVAAFIGLIGLGVLIGRRFLV
jgi:hypothetical protein